MDYSIKQRYKKTKRRITGSVMGTRYLFAQDIVYFNNRLNNDINNDKTDNNVDLTTQKIIEQMKSREKKNYNRKYTYFLFLASKSETSIKNKMFNVTHQCILINMYLSIC